jgi:hypothetical protein
VRALAAGTQLHEDGGVDGVLGGKEVGEHGILSNDHRQSLPP